MEPSCTKSEPAEICLDFDNLGRTRPRLGIGAGISNRLMLAAALPAFLGNGLIWKRHSYRRESNVS
jgi:hypothetical protein